VAAYLHLRKCDIQFF